VPLNFLVVICGAAGGIGQPLSLLLKQSNLISHLALYDVVNAPGVAADLSHINTKSKVTGHGKEHMADALEGAHTVIIPGKNMVCSRLFFLPLPYGMQR
jgi:malate dehydrogenase